MTSEMIKSAWANIGFFLYQLNPEVRRQKRRLSSHTDSIESPYNLFPSIPHPLHHAGPLDFIQCLLRADNQPTKTFTYTHTHTHIYIYIYIPKYLDRDTWVFLLPAIRLNLMRELWSKSIEIEALKFSYFKIQNLKFE